MIGGRISQVVYWDEAVESWVEFPCKVQAGTRVNLAAHSITSGDEAYYQCVIAWATPPGGEEEHIASGEITLTQPGEEKTTPFAYTPDTPGDWRFRFELWASRTGDVGEIIDEATRVATVLPAPVPPEEVPPEEAPPEGIPLVVPIAGALGMVALAGWAAWRWSRR